MDQWGQFPDHPEDAPAYLDDVLNDTTASGAGEAQRRLGFVNWAFYADGQHLGREEAENDDEDEGDDDSKDLDLSTSSTDYQVLDYVGEVDENLLCPICKEPALDPFTTSCCQQTFCRSCLEEAYEQQREIKPRVKPNCPLCRRDKATFEALARVAPVALRAILNKLPVSCPNACSHTGPGSELAHHVAEICPLVACGDKDCKISVPRRLFKAGECIHPRGCKSCTAGLGVTCSCFEVAVHLSPNPTSCCETCGTQVGCDDLDEHVKACLEVEVACKHAYIGCEVRKPRGTIKQHEAVCPQDILRREKVSHRFEIRKLQSELEKVKGELNLAIRCIRSSHHIVQLEFENSRMDDNIRRMEQATSLTAGGHGVIIDPEIEGRL